MEAKVTSETCRDYCCFTTKILLAKVNETAPLSLQVSDLDLVQEERVETEVLSAIIMLYDSMILAFSVVSTSR